MELELSGFMKGLWFWGGLPKEVERGSGGKWVDVERVLLGSACPGLISGTCSVGKALIPTPLAGG